MKRRILCDGRKGGCDKIYEVEETLVIFDQYIQCPYCGRIALNPLYQGEEK